MPDRATTGRQQSQPVVVGLGRSTRPGMGRTRRRADSKEISGVGRGMYRPLGAGDVDFAAIVSYLTARDYDGWYVLEQDTILTEAPRGEGPVTDVRRSAGYLRQLLA
jgi:sugar phosphate isomerase/epimerase